MCRRAACGTAVDRIMTAVISRLVLAMPYDDSNLWRGFGLSVLKT